MLQASAHASLIRRLSESSHTAEMEPCAKRARLSPSPGSASTAASSSDAPTRSLFRDRSDDPDSQDGMTTPERDSPQGSSALLDKVVVKQEPREERWIEIEAQYAASPLPSPQPRGLEELPKLLRARGESVETAANAQDAQAHQAAAADNIVHTSGAGSSSSADVRLASLAQSTAQERADETSPKVPVYKSVEYNHAWPAEWEEALMSYILSDATLRSWAVGGSFAGVNASLTRFSHGIEGMKPKSAHRKTARMRDLVVRFHQQLTPAAKASRVEQWTNLADMNALAKYESFHATQWLRRWHNEFGCKTSNATSTSPAPLAAASASSAAASNGESEAVPASNQSQVPSHSLGFTSMLPLGGQLTSQASQATAQLQQLQQVVQQQARQLAQFESTSTQQMRILVEQTRVLTEQADRMAKMEAQIAQQAQKIERLEKQQQQHHS